MDLDGAMFAWPAEAQYAPVAWDMTAAAMDEGPVMHLWFVGVRGSCRGYHPCDAPLVGAVAGVGVGLFAPDVAVLRGSDSLAHLFPMSPVMTTLVPSYVGCVPDPAA